jgi:Sugar efflux transporter for intercellular exchange
VRVGPGEGVHQRPHFPGAPGWEEVADYAFDWAAATRRSRSRLSETSVRVGPQDLRHRSSREVSVAYFWVLLVGFALWIAYGVVIDNWFLIVPNAVALTVSAATIAVAPRFQPRIQQG